MIHQEYLNILKEIKSFYEKYKLSESKIKSHFNNNQLKNKNFIFYQIVKYAKLDIKLHYIGSHIKNVYPDFGIMGELHTWQRFQDIVGYTKRAEYQIVSHKAIKIINLFNHPMDLIEKIDKQKYKELNDIIDKLEAME